MEAILSESIALPRLQTLAVGLFGGIALLLTMVGIYGVVSYVVTQRTHEIGIRMALGARPTDVVALVVRQSMNLFLWGILAGTAAALFLTKFMRGLLYEIKPTEPLTFVGVALLLVGVALLACYLPARHAAQIHPMEALRHQ
jgi:putative ABC transport system permease protein